MASVSIVVRKRVNKDKEYPLGIRITKNRKPSYIYFDQSVAPKDWDDVAKKVKKSHPNSARLNNFLLTKLKEYTDKLLEEETVKPDQSVKKLRDVIRNKKNASFFDAANGYLADLKLRGKFNIRSADEPRINRFKEFLNGRDISFSEISVGLLNDFTSHIKNTRVVSDRTIINHLVAIRSVYTYAKKRQTIDEKHYPFGKGKISIKFPDTKKVGLNKDEVDTIEGIENPTDDIQLTDVEAKATDIWLFSYYFAGIRISDELRLEWTDLLDGRLHYSMGKNGKVGSLKIPSKAQAIIDKYMHRKAEGKRFVFPELDKVEKLNDEYEVQRQIALAVTRLNKALERVRKKAKLEKKLTLHVSRHTFGNISGDKIPLQMLQKLYRHTSITTTIGYQSNWVYKNEDEALDSVIN